MIPGEPKPPKWRICISRFVPGTDAFLLGALLATLVRSDRIDHAFIEEHTIGFAEVRQALLDIPVEEWAAAADISIADLERCAAMIVAAKAMVVRVELGIQQGINSTLNSYLEKLLIMLSGNFGRKGTNQLHSWLQPLWGNSPNQTFAPTGDAIIGGLLPPNIFPEAVLKDHPDRLRCAWIDSSNPANTAANTEAVERALRSLDLCVVVDVAMTETARLAHYVLPASSQFEKTEFTLFNFEFPTNYFHVRAGVLPPLAGTLPEPEIYTRLAIALGLLPGDNVLAPLREAARRSRAEFAIAFRAFVAENPRSAQFPPWCSTIRWGRRFRTARRPRHPCGARLWLARSDRRKRCGGRSAHRTRWRIISSAISCSTPS